MSFGPLHISKRQFDRLRLIFMKSVNAASVEVTLSVISQITASADAMTSFVGDESKTVIIKRVKALYTRNYTQLEREKFGLSQEVNAVVYIPPQTLIEAFPGMDYRRLVVDSVEIAGEAYSPVNYLLSGHLYNSTLFVEIQLRIATRL
jgi:hypothetical protein